MRRRLRLAFSGRCALGVALMLVLLSGATAATALADDPPPATTVVVTVTTPVTAPPPDPAPTPSKPKPVQKHHVQAPPKVTPTPTPASSTPTTAGNAHTSKTSVFRPPTVTVPKKSAGTHLRKRSATIPKVHKVKTVAPKKVAPKAKPVAANPVAPVSTKPVHKSAVPVSAVAKRGGLTGELRLALFSIVAALLLAVTAVVEVNRRRHRPRAVSEFVATAEPPLLERPAEPPVLERPAELPPPKVIAVEPPVRPIVESEALAADPFEDDFDEVPVYDDRCEITAWRGYAKWRFYGRIDTADGEVALVESRPFRAPGSTAPEATPAAEAAHSELLARLESEGWLRVDGGERWFELSFIRRDSQEAAIPVGSPDGSSV